MVDGIAVVVGQENVNLPLGLIVCDVKLLRRLAENAVKQNSRGLDVAAFGLVNESLDDRFDVILGNGLQQRRSKLLRFPRVWIATAASIAGRELAASVAIGTVRTVS
jgi:hypothetical protein